MGQEWRAREESRNRGLAIASALGRPREGFEEPSAVTWLEFQQDPSCGLLEHRLQEGSGEQKDLLSACSDVGERGWRPEPGCWPHGRREVTGV